jgi:hypothetical protein
LEPPYFLQKIVDILNCLPISGMPLASNIVAIFDVVELKVGHIPIVHVFAQVANAWASRWQFYEADANLRWIMTVLCLRLFLMR